MPRTFRLVICDGPPSDTHGGRYGVLPLLQARMAPAAIILLDDVDRAGEREVLARWRDEAALETRIRETPSGAFALATFG